MDPQPAVAVTKPSDGTLALSSLLLGAGGIAFAPIFVRLSELGPTATAFYRLLFALPALWLWLQVQNRGPQRPAGPRNHRDRARLAAAGLFFAGDLALWHWSIVFTSVANATLLANVAPIFVTLGAWVFFGERFSPLFLAGLLSGIGGAVILMADSVTISRQHVIGDGLGLLTAVFYGAYLLTVSRLRRDFSTATIMTWSGGVTCLALLPVALLSGESLVATSLYGWMILLCLGLISHAGGQSLIAYDLAHLPAGFSAVSLLLQPVIAALLAWALLAESLTPLQGLGGAVVLVGISLARRGSR